MAEITKLLADFGNGTAKEEDVVVAIYDEIKRIARSQLKAEKPGITLQATALANEVYLRLFPEQLVRSQNRSGLFAAIAEAMRRILVDQARRKLTCKRGGGMGKHSLDAVVLEARGRSQDVLKLDQALQLLDERDPDVARLVKLRYFVGMTTKEAAEEMNTSISSANRMWSYAKAFLHREIQPDD